MCCQPWARYDEALKPSATTPIFIPPVSSTSGVYTGMDCEQAATAPVGSCRGCATTQTPSAAAGSDGLARKSEWESSSVANRADAAVVRNGFTD